MDYSRALFSTDLPSIKSGSCVCWPGLLRFTWYRSCLGSSWLVEVVVPDGSVNCFSSLLSSPRQLYSLIVQTLAPIVYGFVPMQPHLLGAVGLYATISQLDALSLICLPGWICILYLRSLLCSLIHLFYPGTSTLELLPRFCVLSNYCCPAIVGGIYPCHYCDPCVCKLSLSPAIVAIYNPSTQSAIVSVHWWSLLDSGLPFTLQLLRVLYVECFLGLSFVSCSIKAMFTGWWAD